MKNNNKLSKRSVSPLRRLNHFGMFPSVFDIFDEMMSDFPGITDNLSDVSVNLKESDSSHQIQLSAPGYKKDNFKIDIDDNRITISNQFSDEKSDESERYSYKEFRQSSFSRSFYLPENSNVDDIKAKYEDGILYIDIPKKEIVKKTKQIEIS